MINFLCILFSGFIFSFAVLAENNEAVQTLSQIAPPQETSSQEVDLLESPVADKQPQQVKQNANKKEPEEEKNIYLNFENTSLNNVVNYMAELKKINLISHKDLESAKVSLSIAEPLSISGAWKIFLTLLETAGFTIILPENSEVYRIVPKDTKYKEPLPLYFNVPAETLPDSDLTIRYVMMLTNVTADMVQELLSSMLTNPPLKQDLINGFLIIDKAYNIKSAMRVIQELDQTGLKEEVSIIKLERANARDVKETLMDLMNPSKDKPMNIFASMMGKHTENNMTYFAAGTKIIAEERGNRLILLGTKSSIERIITFVTTYLDTEIKEVESPLHIYELQYADATQIKEILDNVVKIESESPAAKVGGIRAGVKYFRPMNIKADKDGNRLLISTTDKQDWFLLKKTIQDLDKAQPQIAIETLIVSVDITNNKKLGGALRNKKNGSIGKDINFQANPGNPITINTNAGAQSLLGNMIANISTGAAAVGTTAFTLGSETNIWAAFQALKTQQNSRVVSCPFITVVNRVPATISVGDTKLVEANRSGSGASLVVGQEPQEATTKIVYTPQINLDGLINMKINAQIKEFTSETGNFINKTLDTNVTIANGQVLVLGGFIKTKVDETTGETPLISKIPILGWFFKNKSRTVGKSYIFFFICPTIVKPRTQPGMELYTKMKLHEATDEVEDTIETKKTRDPLFNWFFNSEKESYSHKIVDYANARYQPTTVDIEDDPYYRTTPKETPGKLAEEEKPRERGPEIHLTPPEIITTNKKPTPQAPQEQPQKPIEKNEPSPKKVQPIPTTEEKKEAPIIKLVDQKPEELGMPLTEIKPEEIMAPQVQAPEVKTIACNEPSVIKQRNRLQEVLARTQMTKPPYTVVSAA